ncbi:ChrR family anti-sigma-E factor [Amphritea sp. 2_MG-2023]|uniref:ChrR family anti-sigma-E factor n=1 Tax=Amphritea TaxID=515417 RepID=UPI001C075729|nr:MULTISPECIES: ChrR family anti-sigma-E factor [Amphritea]MBU2964180.1 ChrR family anti-sigma-E factor [Amphritea atlantica]MDO6418579.1 ChrR family anti-sigma-E factor [Amphritea sp. 2_MG-2023]
MNINHHLDDATLMSYSAGSLSQGMALVVASHLAFCSACRERAEMNDAVGGVLLESLDAETIEDDMLAAILAQIDEPLERRIVEPRQAIPSLSDPEIPVPLNEYVSGPLDQLEWKRIVPGVAYYDMPWQGRGVSRLLRIAPGKSMLTHTHNGNELTLVLRGSFSDEVGRFCRGDIADLDDQIEHQPLVDSDEDCICLIATDAPLRFTTLFGKLVQPMTGF